MAPSPTKTRKRFMSYLAKSLAFGLLSFAFTTPTFAADVKRMKNSIKTSTTTVSKPIKVTSNTKSVSMVKIDLNRASAKEIAKFKGFGPKRSQAIVDYRNIHGIFKKFDDLSLVKGISKRFVEKKLIKLKETFNI